MADNKDNVAKEHHVVEDEKVVESTNNAKDEKKTSKQVKALHLLYKIKVNISKKR